MRLLGIDYGKRKMGLAISEGELSSPLKVIAVSGLEDALSKTRQVIDQEKIERIVVGVPDSGEARSITKKFILGLKAFASVIETDETLSTHNATALMNNLNIKKSSKGREDAYAAMLILQNYLDNR